MFMRGMGLYKVAKICNRFVHTVAKLKKNARWLKPDGYQTNILIYNPITKSKVPLILKNKDVLSWYVCGPTVYDSAHIGHAMTFVHSDIIRRILSEHFNINIVQVMCITDIDDKIIKRSKEFKRNYKEVGKHYENEFMEDMKMLNVIKPHLYCRVSDYIPQIIQFIERIISKENAYVSKDGSVYFDTTKCETYGKFSQQVSNYAHPDKKTSMDFCLWKAAIKDEPFWESPWGHGRPGWHIECSTIASTIFGNSVDIHSGGIDLAFPHHENEEAQSCCYHEVKQWVNYWLHCGHLFLQDEKMSKSLKNTISIREFLKKYTANQFRIICLLTNYKTGLEFSDAVMDSAQDIIHKIEHFVSDCDNYIAGRWNIGNIDENTLFHCLEETKSSVNAALVDDFNTAHAMKLLINLINVTNKMLHDTKSIRKNNDGCTTCIPAVVAVLNYVSETFSMFGISSCTIAGEERMNNLVECFMKFRHAVRNKALEQDEKDKSLLTACDLARTQLAACGVTIKDQKTETVWSIKKY